MNKFKFIQIKKEKQKRIFIYLNHLKLQLNVSWIENETATVLEIIRILLISTYSYHKSIEIYKKKS